MRPRRAFVLLVLTAGSLLDCSDLYPSSTGVYDSGIAACTNDDTDPTQGVSFTGDLVPIIDRAISIGPGCSCHLPTSSNQAGIQMGGLSLATYNALRAGGFHSHNDIVIPGQPCASVLYEKITAPPFGARMPKQGGYLADDEIRLFHDWIAEGANDN